MENGNKLRLLYIYQHLFRYTHLNTLKFFVFLLYVAFLRAL